MTKTTAGVKHTFKRLERSAEKLACSVPRGAGGLTVTRSLTYIFKNIFGTEKNKSLLISFLNALFKGNPHIVDLTFDNPNIEKILERDKASRLDILATTDNKTKIDIEIQCKNTGEIP